MHLDFRTFKPSTYVFKFQAAVFGEMLGSNKASGSMLLMYSPFMGFAVLALLRGLLPSFCKPAAPTAAIKAPAMAMKKRA